MLRHMGDKVSSILVGRFCACSLNISLMILVYSFFLSSLISWRRSIAYPLLLINSRKGWIARRRRVSFAALLCTGFNINPFLQFTYGNHQFQSTSLYHTKQGYFLSSFLIV